jgi:hypothetical protein
MPKYTLLDNQNGPVSSSAYVVAYDEDNPGLARIINIAGRAASWANADLLVETCHDLTASPQRWMPAQVLVSGALANLTIEGDFSIIIELPPEVAFRVRHAGDGSPSSPVTVSAVGPITLAT